MNLVVLHQGAIGDFVLALSVIQAVRACTGADRVLAIAGAPSARLAAGRSAVDAWLSPETAALYTLFREGEPDGRLADCLKDADLILSFLSSPSDEIQHRLVRISGARVISLDPRPTAETIATRTHITAQWTAVIRTQGLAIPEPSPAQIRISREGGACRPHSDPLPKTGDQRRAAMRILIHPGAGSPTKCWPAERYVTLADALAPATIHWMLGPAELECDPVRFAPIRQRVAARNEPLLVEEDLLRAAEHIANMDLYIGNDAGMTHIVAALSIPTIAIYGPTDPNVWRPLGHHVRTVGPSTPSPITAVTTEAVLRASAAVRSSPFIARHDDPT